MKPVETQTRKRIRGSLGGLPIWISGAEEPIIEELER